MFLEHVRIAEDLGFHAFFHNDKKWAREPHGRLGAAAAVSSRIGLGISVVDPYTRHPAVTAQASATLAEMAPGRFTLVMGAGSHFETLPGYSVHKPVVAIREATDLLRRLWAGEEVTINGEVVQFQAGRLDFEPTSIPQIWVAGRGPKVLTLAGEVGDGVLVGSFASPSGIEYARRHVGEGLALGGRSWADIELASWLYVGLLKRRDDPVPEAMRTGISFAFWSSRNALMGVADELGWDLTAEFRAFVRDAPRSWAPEVMAGLRRVIPKGLLASLAVVGTAEQVLERLGALEGAGVQQAVIWPFPAEGTTVKDFIVELGTSVVPRLSAAS